MQCSPAGRSLKSLLRATCTARLFHFTSYSISASFSVPMSYANKRTLLIFKLCRNCSANYQSFSTLPSDALELWPNICFLTLKLVGAGHAVCSVLSLSAQLSSVLCGVFPLRVFADFSRKFLAKVDVKWKNCQFLLFSYGEGKGAAGREAGRVERNISTHKTFMRRTISGLASAELKRVIGGEGERQLRLNSWQIALCTPLSVACHTRPLSPCQSPANNACINYLQRMLLLLTPSALHSAFLFPAFFHKI